MVSFKNAPRRIWQSWLSMTNSYTYRLLRSMITIILFGSIKPLLNHVWETKKSLSTTCFQPYYFMVTSDVLMTSNANLPRKKFPSNSALVFSSSSRYPRANPIPETNKTPRWPMGNGCNVSGSKIWQVYLGSTKTGLLQDGTTCWW